jgi:hypothetical protein
MGFFNRERGVGMDEEEEDDEGDHGDDLFGNGGEPALQVDVNLEVHPTDRTEE